LLGIPSGIARNDAVSLTFDDGPDPDATPAVLAELERIGAPATFFLVGEAVERDPPLVAEIVAAGHEVAVHCYRHRSPLLLTPRQARDDLHRATDAIRAATEAELRYYRPAYGFATTAALATARALGLQPVLWTRAGYDWEAVTTAEEIATRAAHDLEGGDVILLHDGRHPTAERWQRTRDAIPLVAEAAAARGLALAPLDDPVS
jgi:peptidoglycan/xylan/chitin deacetylase (PgdA/CDA1 family)